MKILALSDCLVNYHSFWIRVGQYLEELSTNNAVIITDDIKMLKILTTGDTLIIYRHNSGWGDITKELEKILAKGVRIISDVDDYLWFDGTSRGWSIDRLKYYTRSLRKCNIITCSTKNLYFQLTAMFSRQYIFLIPNTEPKYYNHKEKSKTGIIRVGWTGAPWTRPQDLQLIEPIIERIRMNTQIYKMVHVGHSERYPTLASMINMPDHLIEKHELSGHKDYLDKLDFDIGLAPLAETQFNHYKSGIKVIEYSSRGIPWIASKVSSYTDICEEWNIKGRLCANKNDWLENLEQLTDEKQRNKEGILMKKIAKKRSSFSEGLNRWKIIVENKNNS